MQKNNPFAFKSQSGWTRKPISRFLFIFLLCLLLSLGINYSLQTALAQGGSYGLWLPSILKNAKPVTPVPPPTTEPPPTVEPSTQPWIVFWSYTSVYDNMSDIYIMKADGSNRTRITNNWGHATNPAWSPDHKLIAFAGTSFSTGFASKVFVTDGKQIIQITFGSGEDNSPVWSPDGKKIAFHSTRHGFMGIYILDFVNGTLTKVTPDTLISSEPSWSPDGDTIAFQCILEGNEEICLIGADGSNPRRLTASGGKHSTSPDWSPDGGKIVFTSNYTGHWQIYTINTDGTRVSQLTSTNADNTDPSWSPNGDRIAFTSNRVPTYDIFTMKTDGTDQKNITNSDDLDYGPDW